MMAILHAINTWKPYLLRHHFKIKTDDHSLKYFLEQCLSSPEQHKWAMMTIVSNIFWNNAYLSLEQHKWVTKMLGYDYEIIYKKGKDNVMEDVLSL